MYLGSVIVDNRLPAAPVSRATYTVQSRFGEVLDNTTGPLAESEAPISNYTVQSGDTLTGIVQRQLSQMGRPSGASEVYEAVRQVSRHNGLRNPDRLSVGQKLDLAPLGTSVQQVAPSSSATRPSTVSSPSVHVDPPVSRLSAPQVQQATPERQTSIRRGAGKVFRHVSRMPSQEPAPLKLAIDKGQSPVLVPSTAYGNLGVGGPEPGRDGMSLRAYREPGNLVSAVRHALHRSPAAVAAEDGAIETRVTMDGNASWSKTLREPARISSGYGMRRDPFTGRPAFHKGVDLAVKSGTEVYPVQEGVVKYSGWQSGYGRIVILEHEDGMETVYAHNSANLVKPGQLVGTDTPIAKVGSSGRSTGPHLHFEVRKDGRAVDPVPHLH